MLEATRGATQPVQRGTGTNIAHALKHEYTILGELGSGGMGVVYAAIDHRLGRRVAIKQLRQPPSPRLQSRLVSEAKAMAMVVSPHVVRVFKVLHKEGGPYIVMELVQGESLRRWVLRRERCIDQIIKLFVQAGHGLWAIHKAGLVHRDFKPDNVLVDHHGTALVADLGIAVEHGHATGMTTCPNTRLHEPDSETTVLMTGSPRYMSPEQQRGERLTDKSDQYSFAVALWECIFDSAPKRASGRPSAQSQQVDALHDSELPSGFVNALTRALSERPGDRFPTMPALLAELDKGGEHTTLRTHLAFWIHRHRRLIATLAFAVSATSQIPIQHDEREFNSQISLQSLSKLRLESSFISETQWRQQVDNLHFHLSAHFPGFVDRPNYMHTKVELINRGRNGLSLAEARVLLRDFSRNITSHIAIHPEWETPRLPRYLRSTAPTASPTSYTPRISDYIGQTNETCSQSYNEIRRVHTYHNLKDTRSAYMIQNVDPGPFRGKFLELEGWYRVQGPPSSAAKPLFFALDSSGRGLLPYYTGYLSFHSNHWEKFRIPLYVSTDAPSIVIGGIAFGEGSSLFDGFRLYERKGHTRVPLSLPSLDFGSPLHERWIFYARKGITPHFRSVQGRCGPGVELSGYKLEDPEHQPSVPRISVPLGSALRASFFPVPNESESSSQAQENLNNAKR